MAMSPEIDPAPYAPLPPLVRLGDIVAEKYRLDRILGAGGMGVVVGAMHLQLRQRIAIKFMSPQLVDSEDGVARFLREARLAAGIQCEHVVRVFDVAALDDGTPYIVMEHLVGEDLRQALQRRGRLTVAEAIDCVLQASEAIAEAHVAGIVHRDLKPGNLFCSLRADGSTLVKVLDFGVSKLLRKADLTSASRARSTDPHMIMGSPLYSSPEQLRAPASVDARADIWALGAILYELLEGRPPFSGATLLEICTNVMYGETPSLSAVQLGIPYELDAVVARSLAKSPAQRFGSIADLARALAPFASAQSRLSVERIENVVRRAGPVDQAGAPVRTERMRVPAPCAKTLPSRPDAPATGRRRGRPPGSFRRWVVSVAAAAAASAVFGATVAQVATGGSSPARGELAAPSAIVSAASPQAVPATPTAGILPEPTEIVPLTETTGAEAPGAPSGSAPGAVGGKAIAPPRRRLPDTSQFGGLQ
jgi:serine/threonine-protein kinase